jgi:membrane-bound acyltransferase YfiQ involved in biofilm formation
MNSDRIIREDMRSADRKTLVNAVIAFAAVIALAFVGMAMAQPPKSQGMTVIATVKKSD